MPNLAAALKAEIARIARKELRSETEALKKQSTSQRAQIAALKRAVAQLEGVVRRLSKSVTSASSSVVESAPDTDRKLRFRAAGFAKHRQRLGLSAADVGLLLGVSGQTVYHWEAAKARPRASQLPRIDALRNLTKKSAAAAMEQVSR